MRTKSILAVVIGSVMFIAGCGRDLSGTWVDEAGVTSYEFRPDGRARISVLGTTVAAEYTLDGDKVLVTSPQGTVVLKRHDDRLYGPMGLELVRRPD